MSKEEKMSDYNKFTAMLASEFHRYLMEDEERAPMLPENVLLIFEKESRIFPIFKRHCRRGLRQNAKFQDLTPELEYGTTAAH